MLLLLIQLFQLNNASTWLGDAGSDLLGDDDGVEDQEAHIGCERSQDHSRRAHKIILVNIKISNNMVETTFQCRL